METGAQLEPPPPAASSASAAAAATAARARTAPGAAAPWKGKQCVCRPSSSLPFCSRRSVSSPCILWVASCLVPVTPSPACGVLIFDFVPLHLFHIMPEQRRGKANSAFMSSLSLPAHVDASLPLVSCFRLVWLPCSFFFLSASLSAVFVLFRCLFLCRFVLFRCLFLCRTQLPSVSATSFTRLIKALRDAVLDLHGDFGYGSMQQTLSGTCRGERGELMLRSKYHTACTFYSCSLPRGVRASPFGPVQAQRST